MQAQPPRTLKRLLKQYGQELIDDPRRTEALLRDHCGQHTREIFVLVNAQKQHVPNDLLAAPTWMPRQATYTRLSRQLQTKLALTEDAANWAVAAWAAALELDALPKGDGWAWLPEPLRGPAPKSSRKRTSKKRQNSASRVQSTKSTTSATTATARKAKERSARAEMGWSFPVLSFPDFSQFSWRRFFPTQVVWSNLLPWLALSTATIFLLAVVYWTSTNRTVAERGMSTLPTAAEASNGAIVESGDGPQSGETATSAPNVTPLPELPQPGSDYLNEVMPLPMWANVNAEEPLLVRQEPSTNAPYLNVLQDGAPVSVVAYSNDGLWSQITSPYAGWVNNQFLHFYNENAKNSYVILNVLPRRTQDHEVSVYAQPDTGAEVTSTLSPDEFVVVAAQMDEPATWYQVADPVVGWVIASDLAPQSP